MTTITITIMPSVDQVIMPTSISHSAESTFTVQAKSPTAKEVIHTFNTTLKYSITKGSPKEKAVRIRRRRAIHCQSREWQSGQARAPTVWTTNPTTRWIISSGRMMGPGKVVRTVMSDPWIVARELETKTAVIRALFPNRGGLAVRTGCFQRA